MGSKTCFIEKWYRGQQWQNILDNRWVSNWTFQGHYCRHYICLPVYPISFPHIEFLRMTLFYLWPHFYQPTQRYPTLKLWEWGIILYKRKLLECRGCKSNCAWCDMNSVTFNKLCSNYTDFEHFTVMLVHLIQVHLCWFRLSWVFLTTRSYFWGCEFQEIIFNSKNSSCLFVSHYINWECPI